MQIDEKDHMKMLLSPLLLSKVACEEVLDVNGTRAIVLNNLVLGVESTSADDI